MNGEVYKGILEFSEFVKNYGVSLNNTFVVFYEGISSELETQLKNRLDIPDLKTVLNHLTFMVENVELPPVNLATGEYRYGNSPQFKYPYAQIYNPITISYILDSTFVQREFFDVWVDYIYNLSNRDNSGTTLRVPYKDDYTMQLTIAKYDRCSRKNRGIIDDSPKFNYSVQMVNAYPVSVSAIPLSNAASDLTRVSVTYEYDIMRQNVNFKGSVNNNISGQFNP